jgi:MFS transporter, DHA2 family, multidrug resistance protein
MFVTSAIMYASLALLPPMLTMLDYPIVTTGLLQVPRGIAMMVGIMIAGRLVTRIDIRVLLGIGLLAAGGSLWLMTGFTPDMDSTPIIVTGLIQGIGFGFLYAPINVAAFATLPSSLRTEGTGVYSLIRNIGSSIGISLCETLLDQNIQVNHASLAQSITPFNTALQQPAAQHFWPLQSTAGLSALDQLVNFQAAMIAYIDDYKFMMIVCIAALPLLFLLRPSKTKDAAHAPALE